LEKNDGLFFKKQRERKSRWPGKSTAKRNMLLAQGKKKIGAQVNTTTFPRMESGGGGKNLCPVIVIRRGQKKGAGGQKLSVSRE